MEKVIKISILLVLFITVVSSCKKTEPFEVPITINDIIFSVSGDFNGVPISYSAGENDYYMYSDFNYYTASPYNFTSELKQNNCSHCPNSVGITLSSYNYDTLVNNFNINQAINDSSQFNYYYDSSSSGIIFPPSNITVYYINNNGIKYKSNYVSIQNGYFNITNIENFDNNELGQKTKKVDFNLSCLVSSSDVFLGSDSLTLSGTFAFSYPSP